MTLPLPFAEFFSGGDTHWAPSSAFTPDGTVVTGPPNEDFINEVTINNPHPGPTQNYSIRLNAGGEGGFQFDGTTPTSGTIRSADVLDENGFVYFSIDLSSSSGDTDLVDFFTTLHNSGAKAALDQLVGEDLTLRGSTDADHAETYGVNGRYDLGDGNDFLDISYSFTTAYGDAGNDRFTISKGGLLGLSLHGASPLELLPTPETNTIVFAAAGTLFFDEIDGFTNFKFAGTGGAQFIYLKTDQLPGGSPSHFQVVGSRTGQTNEMVIERATGDAVHLNLTGVNVVNFARLDQAFIFDFTDDVTTPRSDSVKGVLGARNIFEFGNGADSATGGNRADIFTGGHGKDFFNGGGGNDTANFDGARSHFTITQLDAHKYSVHDNRLHSPDGTDTLVNVEYLAFTDGYVFIGGSTGATATSLVSAHHFDLLT